MKLVINGRFLARPLTGTERFAQEVIYALDNIVKKGEVEIVAPKYATKELTLSNIRIVKYGSVHNHLWEQTNLLYYILKNKVLCLSFCNTVPLLCPGIAVLHDISYKTHPEFYKAFRAILSMYWHRIHYWFICRFAKHIFTVSEYSKQEIISVYQVNPTKITVVGSAWQHTQRISFDERIYEEYPALKEQPFFFTLGSLAINKNIPWVIQAAENNPQYLFCISGQKSKNGDGYSGLDIPENVIFMGRLSDEHVKTLMCDCKAFVFPSLFEGFGLPPLEAMSVGANIIVSNAASLPEIYEDSAVYINPHNPNVDMGEFLKQKPAGTESILKKYSWEGIAKQIRNITLSM